jgi:hypothetical protein
LGKTTGEQQPIVKHFGQKKIHLYNSGSYDFLREIDVLFD